MVLDSYQHPPVNVTNDDNDKDDDLLTRTSVDISTLCHEMIFVTHNLYCLLLSCCPSCIDDRITISTRVQSKMAQDYVKSS